MHPTATLHCPDNVRFRGSDLPTFVTLHGCQCGEDDLVDALPPRGTDPEEADLGVAVASRVLY